MFRWLACILLPAFALLVSCQKETQVERANREGILLVGNASEPKSLDLHLVTGVIESKVIDALFEGLVANDAVSDDVTPPGAAASWDHNEALTEWTFHLQPNAKWSDGVPVTAHDFVFAYHRLLHPDLAGPYADMLYFLENAEAYNRNSRGLIFVRTGQVPGVSLEMIQTVSFHPDESVNIDDFGKSTKWTDLKKDEHRLRFIKNKGLDALGSEPLKWILADPTKRFPWPPDVKMDAVKKVLTVMSERPTEDLFELSNIGVKALDDLTLQIKLREPVPFLPSLTRHYTWFPAPEHTILKYGKMEGQDNPWSDLGKIVGNGAFKLVKWRFHDVIEVDRNPYYWDAKNVGLNGIRFLPIENAYTETRGFLSGQLHTTYQLPSDLIKSVKETTPEFLRQEPYVANTFVRFNTNRPGLSDPRVRQALSLTIDRQQICDYISEGYKVATSFTPKMGNYEPTPVLTFDPEKARKLLAEAGYPNGDKFPRFSMLIAKDSARPVAEALQAMWKTNLNILVDIQNKDWASYVSAQQSLDYDIALAAWTGDYLDPTTFLNMWTKGNGNNNTAWSDAQFEAKLREAAQQADQPRRLALLGEAETILMRDQPIAPISFYVRNYLHRPEVKGWYPLLLDHHPWKTIYLEK